MMTAQNHFTKWHFATARRETQLCGQPAGNLASSVTNHMFQNKIYTAKILIINDRESELVELETILRRANYQNIITARDARHVLPIFGTAKPDLILLNLHMPHLDGFDLLQQISPRVSADEFLPILVLAPDISAEGKTRALMLGAKDFLNKPFDHIEVTLRIQNLLETRFLYRELNKRTQTHQARIRARNRELELAEFEILERLALAAEYRDDDTSAHQTRVGQLAALLAKRLGLEPEQVALYSRAAPLHDLGKIGIPDSILLKPGKLTTQEYEVVKQHTVIGAKMLAGSVFPLLQLSEEIALTHHERWDGKGYAGLAEDEVPLSGRLVAVVDVFDALTHLRPYKNRWSVARALDEIKLQSGKQFDPQIAAAFIEMISAEPDAMIPDEHFANRVPEVSKYDA